MDDFSDAGHLQPATATQRAPSFDKTGGGLLFRQKTEWMLTKLSIVRYTSFPGLLMGANSRYSALEFSELWHYLATHDVQPWMFEDSGSDGGPAGFLHAQTQYLCQIYDFSLLHHLAEAYQIERRFFMYNIACQVALDIELREVQIDFTDFPTASQDLVRRLYTTPLDSPTSFVTTASSEVTLAGLPVGLNAAITAGRTEVSLAFFKTCDGGNTKTPTPCSRHQPGSSRNFGTSCLAATFVLTISPLSAGILLGMIQQETEFLRNIGDHRILTALARTYILQGRRFMQKTTILFRDSVRVPSGIHPPDPIEDPETASPVQFHLSQLTPGSHRSSFLKLPHGLLLTGSFPALPTKVSSRYAGRNVHSRPRHSCGWAIHHDSRALREILLAGATRLKDFFHSSIVFFFSPHRPVPSVWLSGGRAPSFNGLRDVSAACCSNYRIAVTAIPLNGSLSGTAAAHFWVNSVHLFLPAVNPAQLMQLDAYAAAVPDVFQRILTFNIDLEEDDTIRLLLRMHDDICVIFSLLQDCLHHNRPQCLVGLIRERLDIVTFDQKRSLPDTMLI
ncbi:hypothetical protein K438DRAFT_1774341 [Mycena galopus ATCC 62051]|nr:hypothetical protein K438DRAFT_1774341 [Mycena galopus ATCC 62051]